MHLELKKAFIASEDDAKVSLKFSIAFLSYETQLRRNKGLKNVNEPIKTAFKNGYAYALILYPSEANL